jgi:hypothetical protein
LRNRQIIPSSQLQKEDEPKILREYLNYLDVGGTFWQDNFESIVFSNDGILIMIESVVENKPSLLIVEEVIPGWHVIALAPINFPLTHDWESWLDSKAHMILLSEGVR